MDDSKREEARALIAEARQYEKRAPVGSLFSDPGRSLMLALTDALEAALTPPADPTDDEREALSSFLFSVYDHGTNPNALKEADAILEFLAARRPTPATREEVAEAPADPIDGEQEDEDDDELDDRDRLAALLYDWDPSIRDEWTGERYGIHEKGAGYKAERAYGMAEEILSRFTVAKRDTPENQNVSRE